MSGSRSACAWAALAALAWTPAGAPELGIVGAPEPEVTREAAPQSPNLLLLIADDVGVDRVGIYGEHPAPGNTPNIDQLAREGLLFRNAWSAPVCSAARSMMLTGRHGFRTGLGWFIDWGSDVGLSPQEISLPDVIRRGTGGRYRCAAVGKWHLAAGQQWPFHPQRMGFESWSGSRWNLVLEDQYDNWTKDVGGVPQLWTVYATTDTVDDALRAIETLPEPWFLWVAFNAAHTPLHEPPSHLHTIPLTGSPATQPIQHFKAMTEAMDTEIGRLLAEVAPEVLARTNVVFVADNGTPKVSTDAPFDPDHGKGSVYEGGLNVPLIVRGPSVQEPGRESEALVVVTDLFSTAAELCGVDAAAQVPAGHALDSVSFMHQLQAPGQPSARQFGYAERFKPNGPGPWIFHDTAVRSERYKLIRHQSPAPDELYDLEHDPFEQSNLLEGSLNAAEEDAYRSLKRALADVRDR